MSNDYYLACPECIRRHLEHNPTLDGAHIHTDVNDGEDSIGHSSFGGVSVGKVVTFKVPDRVLDRSTWLVDGYGGLTTVGQLIDSRGDGAVK